MKKDFSKLTKAELTDLAAKHNIKNPSKLTKDDIVSLLKKKIEKKTVPSPKKNTEKKETKTSLKVPARPTVKTVRKSTVTAIKKESAPTNATLAKIRKKIAATRVQPPTPARSVRVKTVRASSVIKERKPLEVPATKKTSTIQRAQQIKQEAPHADEYLQPQQPQQQPQVYSTPQPTGELPQTYHETKLVVMVRDPYWAYTYWDIADDTYRFIEKLYHEHEGVRPVLRIYDITGVSFNGTNSKRSWDIDVSIDAKNWYLNLGSPGASFVIDLGLKDKTGKFFLIARSNTVALPIDYPSHIIDEKWMISDIDFEELYALSGGFGVGLSSGEAPRKRSKKLEHLEESLSSGGLSSPGMVKVPQKAKEFFLEVATELILYGRTYANATLTVDNKKIKLRPDGTFTLRYFLPDGTLPLPVKAVSFEGDDTREVKIKVEKETK